MEFLVAFWNGNRNEILMTALIMLGIQFVTSAGGYIERKKNMRRLDDPADTADTADAAETTKAKG